MRDRSISSTPVCDDTWGSDMAARLSCTELTSGDRLRDSGGCTGDGVPLGMEMAGLRSAHTQEQGPQG